jgi:hypothetical protein
MVPASVGDTCPALSSQSDTRSSRRGNEEVLRAPWDRPDTRETRILDELIDDILSHERMVNDTQMLAHYSRILMAIRDAKQLGRLLTNDRIKALMEIVPRKENSYWKHDQVGVRPKDMPVAFYSFVRLRALELGSNTSPLRILEDDPEE